MSSNAIRSLGNFNVNLYRAKLNYNNNFLQSAVKTEQYNLNHPKMNDTQGIKASPVANVLDYIC